MTNPDGASIRSTDAGLQRVGRPALGADTARAALVAALTLGLTGDALFSDGPGGLAIFIWVTLLGFNVFVVAERGERPLSRATVGWLAGAVLAAAAMVWRNSGLLVAPDVLLLVACLAMAAVAMRAPRAGLFRSRFLETLIAAVRAVADGVPGWLPLLLSAPRERSAGDGHRAPLGRIARPTSIVVVLLVVFGAMLRGADPIFASFVDLTAIDVGTLIRHALLTLLFAWLAAGWIRSTLARDRAEVGVPDVLSAHLSIVDMTAALGTLDALFALYILAQLGWLFGGAAFLQARTGLTAAEYARHGFFDMTCVVALVIPLLIVARGGARESTAFARRYLRLALPLIALVGAMIVSAALRMRMYVHFYGLTTERFATMTITAWLAFVLLWLAATIVRGRDRHFIAGAFAGGVLALAGLHVADPDAIVARVNVARAAAAHLADVKQSATPAGATPAESLDLRYLAQLSDGAVPIAMRAILAAPERAAVSGDASARCHGAQTLLRRWGPSSAIQARATGYAAWRFWNLDDARAMRVVTENAARLRAIAPNGSCRT